MSIYGADVDQDEATEDEDTPKLPPSLERNLVARQGFPHAKVLRFWNACQAYAKKAWAKNEQDFEEALRWYDGENSQDAGDLDRLSLQSKDAKFVGAMWFADANKLISFFNGRDAAYACSAAKGKRLELTAKATEKLGERITQEMDFRSRNSLVIFEAICRNHGFIRQTWDHYRWLPGWEYCSGEVRFDPDSNGDLKKAKWIIEEYEVSLDDLLDDPEITDQIKHELRYKRECHRKTRFQRNLSEKPDDAPHEWDGVEGFEKLTAYRVTSRMGILPAAVLRKGDGGDIASDDRDSDARQVIGGSAVIPFSEDDFARRTPHMKLRAPPEIPSDAPPTAPPFDPIEHGQRVVVVMVEGFKKILKVVPWPMDHYDRDEWSYIEFRPTRPPNILHGASVFRAIRGYLKVINKAIEYWINIERTGGRKIIEYQKNLDPSEVGKIETGGTYEAIPVDEPGRTFHLTEFAPRVTSFKELIPFLQKLHDDNSGINDAVSGANPEVQETATGARQRMDQAIAALGYIEAEVQRFMEEQARLTVAAAQRYIPKESTFAPCPMCTPEGEDRGTGKIPDLAPAIETMDPLGLAPEPMTVCPVCGGNGWDPEAFQARKRLVKGADFWLPEEMVGAWIDTFDIHEIRAEIIVSVRHGSTRRDYRERELGMLRNAGQDLVPYYQAVGGPVGLLRWRKYVAAIADRAGVANPEDFVPTEEEVAQAVQMQQEQAMAANAPPPGPPPEQVVAEQEQAARKEQEQIAREDAERDAEREMKGAELEHRMDMDRRKADVEDRRLAMEEAPQMAVAEGVAQALAALTTGVQQAMAAIAQTVAGLAQAIQAIQTNATTTTQGAAALAEGATGLEEAVRQMAAAAVASKTVVRDAKGVIVKVISELPPMGA